MPENTDFRARAAAEPTELHKEFAKWIEEQTGVKPDLKTVQIACTMRMDFQKSEENQAMLAKRQEEAKAKKAKAAAAKKAKLEAQMAKIQADLEAAEKEAKGEAAEDEAEKPEVAEDDANNSTDEGKVEHNVDIKLSRKARKVYKASIHTTAEGETSATYTDRDGESHTVKEFVRVAK